MHLTHRNRVVYSRLSRLEYPPLRSPLSRGEGLSWYPFTNNRTKRMCVTEPSPLGRGDRSGN